MCVSATTKPKETPQQKQQTLPQYLTMASPEFTQSHLIIMFIFTSFMHIPYSALLEFNYPTLDEQNPNITVEGSATFLYYSYIKLIRNKKKQIGRVRYFQPMRLWENSLGVLLEADFVTQFSFKIHSDNWAPGDGIAFFLAQPPFHLPKLSR